MLFNSGLRPARTPIDARESIAEESGTRKLLMKFVMVLTTFIIPGDKMDAKAGAIVNSQKAAIIAMNQ